MLVRRQVQNVIVEIIQRDRATQSHSVASELRRRGLEVPSRPVLQLICSTARKASEQ